MEKRIIPIYDLISNSNNISHENKSYDAKIQPFLSSSSKTNQKQVILILEMSRFFFLQLSSFFRTSKKFFFLSRSFTQMIQMDHLSGNMTRLNHLFGSFRLSLRQFDHPIPDTGFGNYLGKVEFGWVHCREILYIVTTDHLLLISWSPFTDNCSPLRDLSCFPAYHESGGEVNGVGVYMEVFTRTPENLYT